MYLNCEIILIKKIKISKCKIILDLAFILVIVINKKVVKTKASFLIL